jgi:hypothetical protein
LRNRTSPVIAAPWSWKTFFARSTPIIVSFSSPSSPLHGSQTIILAHRDAVWRGRQPPRLTELGDWDEAMLRDKIAGLLAENLDLSLLDITDDDLDALLRDPKALGADDLAA